MGQGRRRGRRVHHAEGGRRWKKEEKDTQKCLLTKTMEVKENLNFLLNFSVLFFYYVFIIHRLSNILKYIKKIFKISI